MLIIDDEPMVIMKVEDTLLCLACILADIAASVVTALRSMPR
jgi:hypothetical protein